MDHDSAQQRQIFFDSRMMSWVSRQGLLFQLTHLRMTSGNGLVRSLLSFVSRLAVLGLIVGAIAFFGLRWWVGTTGYRDQVEQELGRQMGAEVLKFKGFEKKGKEARFGELSLEGSADAPFFRTRLIGANFDMPLAQFFGGKWKLGNVELERASATLKSGGGAEMEGIYAGLFQERSRFLFESLRVRQASLEWGYSEATRGRISGAGLYARPDGKGGWKVDLEGGKVSQNWLRDLDIVSMRLRVTPEALWVDEAVLRWGKRGQLRLVGKVFGGAVQPKVDLEGAFEGVDVLDLVSLTGSDVQTRLSGLLAGELRLTGSLTREIQLEGQLQLSDQHGLVMRDGWPLVYALKVLRLNRDLRVFEFTSGQVAFETSKAGLRVDPFELAGERGERLRGSFLVQKREVGEKVGGLVRGGAGLTPQGEGGGKLRNEGRFVLEAEEGMEAEEDVEFERQFAREMGLFSAGEASLRVSHFEGWVELGVPLFAFEGNPRLGESFTVSEDGEVRWVPVRLDGDFSDLSDSEASDLLRRGRLRFDGTERLP